LASAGGNSILESASETIGGIYRINTARSSIEDVRSGQALTIDRGFLSYHEKTNSIDLAAIRPFMINLNEARHKAVQRDRDLWRRMALFVLDAAPMLQFVDANTGYISMLGAWSGSRWIKSIETSSSIAAWSPTDPVGVEHLEKITSEALDQFAPSSAWCFYEGDIGPVQKFGFPQELKNLAYADVDQCFQDRPRFVCDDGRAIYLACVCEQLSFGDERLRVPYIALRSNEFAVILRAFRGSGLDSVLHLMMRGQSVAVLPHSYSVGRCSPRVRTELFFAFADIFDVRRKAIRAYKLKNGRRKGASSACWFLDAEVLAAMLTTTYAGRCRTSFRKSNLQAWKEAE
jgi:hypothetical protein